MIRITCVVCLICLNGLAHGAGEAPKIDRISPPGIQRGTSADVKLSGKPGDGPLQVWTSRSELTFTLSEKQDAATVTAPADATPGVHWVRFHNNNGASGLVPFFVGVIPELPEAEPNNDVATAQKIDQASVLINGILEKSGDVDVYAITAKAGQTLVASMQANRELGSPMDGVLQVLDANGTVLAHNDDDHAFDPQIALPVSSDGMYYVRTFAFPAAPNSTIALAGGATYIYRLTLTTESFIDYVAPATVNADEANELTIHGWNIPDSQQPFALTAFPDLQSAQLADGFANSYEVAASEGPSRIESDESPQSLAPNGSVTGCISSDDETDTFTLQGVKGDKFTITAECRSLYSQLDPVLTVTDETGKVLKEADDRSRGDLDAEAQVTLRQDGPITVKITDRFGSGGERYFYLLKCARTEPVFQATVASDVIVMPDEKPVEVPITIVRSNGFAEKITFTAKDLPAGVSVESVESAKDGDTAKSVKLKLTRTAEAAAFSGEIRIVAQPETVPEQAVTFSITNSPQKLDSVWLTVVAAAVEKPAAEEEAASKEATE